MTGDVHEIPSTTPDLQTELARKLQELVPEAIADGRVDVAKLKELLGNDAATGSERFGLFWPGKRRAQRVAQEPTTATLRPDKADSKDWDTTRNVFIEGDNLEVLKILQKHYHGKIKMIYIDPPYNTGKDFVYPDNYKEGIATYLEFTSQVDEGGKKLSTNSESEGRYHSNWLNMMYPRLKLARNLLKDDGLILISIDDHEQENLKRLMVEVFGENNHVATLVWDTNHSAQAGIFKTYHQYIHVFARRASLVSAPCIGDGEKFEAGAQKRESRRHPVSNFTFPAGTRWDAADGTELTDEWGGAEHTTLVKGRMRCEHGFLAEDVTLAAAWTQKGQMKQFFYGDRDSLVDSRDQPIVDFYFNPSGKIKIVKERGVITPSSVRREYGSQNSISNALAELFKLDASPLDSPKPPEMMREFAEWFTGGGDIVLDFFAGSASTAHGVIEQNARDGASRKFVLVQLPEPTPKESVARNAGFQTISELARKRIDLVGQKIINEYADQFGSRKTSLDVGYRTYRLADTSFSKWCTSSDTDASALTQHLLELRDSAEDEATPDSLLIELLLKGGYSLTERITDEKIAGLSLHSIGGGLVLAYLNEHKKPTLDQLRAVAASKPEKFIILEDAFHGDDELKTNLAQTCKAVNVELWTA